MKGYIVWFKSYATSKGYIYCIAENEDKAKEYMEKVIQGEVLKVDEVDMNEIEIKSLSAGDLVRLIRG